ncbi:hypothetical protein DMX09_07995 [Pseudomonas protegens]|uniref:Lipoprotein n=2 Tax=Pseudomonas TaxID=286 RepID=A0A9Q6IGK8_9PSED|nr:MULTISPECIES: hypothetical protein [Pseudomonas]MBW8354624.1 hypothetical protein [Pseudomonas sp.]MDD1147320.1 hypothetical protein [Pseudomonas idahonensis]MDP9508044.1 hypothetical protein [Pseudomonas protegens]NMY70131.1 hypothetical protein [Pseudomonas sp. WS 5414]PYC07282.1 hypothetical protein DMX09_07995 [Pseudomonas protegens]
MFRRSSLIPLLGSLALLAGTTSVAAQCLPPPRNAEVPGFSLCKDWPAFDDQSISLLSEQVPDPSDTGDGDGTYNLQLAVLDRDSGKPLASYRQPVAFVSDAFRLESVKLDTGRFQLAPQVRAFGVRAGFEGSSRVNPFNQIWLSLYVREGSTLRPVLEKFLAHSYNGEWDGQCAGEGTETTRTLEIAKTRSHGYADLIVRSVSVSTRSEKVGEECQSKSVTAKPVLITLHYDGQRYVLPNGYSGI